MKIRTIYPIVLVPVLSLVIVAALLFLYISPFTHATTVIPRVSMANTASANAICQGNTHCTFVSSTATGQSINLALGLKLRNADNLTAYLKAVTDPQSIYYHHYLNAASFDALYAPLPQSEAAIASFLRSYGFKITATYSNHLLVDAVGTVAQAEAAFQVRINNYRTDNGHLFYANAATPTLPANVAPFVASISGLDDSIQYSRQPITPGDAILHTSGQKQTSRQSTACPQPGSPTYPTSYVPKQIATAYDFNGFYNAGMYGEGQTVGLLELDGFSAKDIATYTACFGGTHTFIKTIPIDGYNGVAGANAAEVELDIETVLGLAPHLSTLRVYEASASSLAAYNDAWARIVSDVTPVVSTSWVFCEEAPGMSGEIAQENIFFQAAAVQGQTILAASGDSGASGCYDPRTGQNTQLAVDDPASQPYVTGVGGTTLRINFDNTIQSEQVWNDRAIKNGASGGGISQVWPMPSWQQGPGVANAYTDGYREVPDVALNADPQTGYDIYCSVGGCAGSHGWQVIGGTSAAAPAWAAMVALANQASIKAGGFLEGFLNPALYDIAHGAPGTSYADAFHDVVPVQGGVNNNDYVGDGGAYPDTTTYDLTTGLGSFDAYKLSQNLNILAQGAPQQNVATSTVWYFAEGRVGADFQEFLTLENPDPLQTAQVRVQYLFEGHTGPAIMHSVPPQSRATVNVNQDLHIPYAGPGYSISMIVTSVNQVGIVAERPMYFSWHGINSGTDALGATKLAQDFYFADIETERNYSSFVTILNPPGGKTANVTVTYVASGGQIGTTTIVVPPGQRGTTNPINLGIFRTCAMYVHSDQPVVVERPMYFTTARGNINGPVTGAATVVGTQAPQNDWLFAEGYTGPNFHEYLVLANFDPTVTANATVTLEYSNGQVYPTTIAVPPQSQYFFDVNAASAGFPQSTTELSAEVTSDSPIVVQRQEYFRFNQNIPGGTDVIGEPGPAKTSYSFAEGFTASGFNEFLTLQNPNTSSETVAVTLYLAHSITAQQIVTIGPQTRVTLNINSIVVPIAQSNPSAGYEVSLSVQAQSGTIVAERPMYFDYGNNTAFGGTDVVGFTG
ncbi:MAG TPA: S53 family peptidase [Ktedonobacteraceae bacterium]|jgi:kumamolisin|nr:S53 family peptidase [Ktedonobacteraceae bacterium]